MTKESNGGFQTERDPAIQSVLAFEAAQTITNDWATQIPIIEGFISQTMTDELTDVVKTVERHEEVLWRVSKGHFLDKDGHRLQLARRLPQKTKRKADDLDYILSDMRVIVNGNIGHVAATVSNGHVIDNDDEMTAVLPENPVGFKKMFETIYDDSVNRHKQEVTNATNQKKYRRGKIAKTVRFITGMGVLAGIGIFGVPKAAEEYFDYRDKNEAEAQAEAIEDAEAIRQSIEAFDSEFTTIDDGVVAIDEERVLVPATTQFVLAENIPRFRTEDTSLEQELEAVRSLRAPVAGESVSYSLPIPEGKGFIIAHTGDPELLVTAYVNQSSQLLTVSSIDLRTSDENTELPSLRTGDIVITLAD